VSRKKSAVIDEQAQQPKVIRDQISQMAPKSVEELEDAPENTNTQTGDEASTRQRGPSGRLLNKDGSERKARQPRNSVPSDAGNLMSDSRYRKAIEGMSFFGAPRIIKRGFQTLATVTADEDFALTNEENGYVEDYFYAVSKHTSFDPMANIIGRLILFILLMGELILPRLLKHSPFAKMLQEMVKKATAKDDSEPTVQ
jgi:hypothetical protein